MAPRTVVREAPDTSLANDTLTPAGTLAGTSVGTLVEPRPAADDRREEPPRGWLRRLGSAVMAVLAVVAFGLFGLLAMVPRLRRARRDRAAACGLCRRNQRVWLGVSAALAVVTLVGGGMRLADDALTVPRCPVQSLSEGASFRDLPQPRNGGLPSRIRAALDAPAGGLAVAYGHWRGQTMCDVRRPSLTVSFIPQSRTTSGSTFGDVFVTPLRPNLDDGQTAALARHEARHSDQWAVATALGGIMLLPVAYVVDQSMYPNELNHFEQSAGLASGGYPHAPAHEPGPRPWALAGWLLLAVLLLRSYLRRVFRSVSGRQRPVAPGRCARHTPGW